MNAKRASQRAQPSQGQPRSLRDQQAEAEFLRNYDPGQFEHPSVSVDVALLTVALEAADRGRLLALLVQRTEHPFQGCWALPGSFVGMEEALDEAAARVLRVKGQLTDQPFLEQLYTFGRVDRDPRHRVITIAYYSLLDRDSHRWGEAREPVRRWGELVVPWEGEGGGPVAAIDEQGAPLPLAFDHAEILGVVVQRLRGKLNYAPLGFELLPEEFTLRQLQIIHETILGRALNKHSFRRRLLASGYLQPTGRREDAVGHRPAELYRFVPPGGHAEDEAGAGTS